MTNIKIRFWIVSEHPVPQYPKRIETYYEKDEEEESKTGQIINGKFNNIENGNNEQYLYPK